MNHSYICPWFLSNLGVYCILPRAAKVSLQAGTSVANSKGHSISVRLAALGCDSIGGSSQSYVHLHTSFDVGGAMVQCNVHKILCQWIQHFVNLWTVVLAKILWAAKANSHLEYVSIPVEMNQFLFQGGSFPVYFSLPSVWLFSQRDGAKSGYQCLFLQLANVMCGLGSGQISPNKLEP